jgi:hypothetical protein
VIGERADGAASFDQSWEVSSPAGKLLGGEKFWIDLVLKVGNETNLPPQGKSQMIADWE